MPDRRAAPSRHHEAHLVHGRLLDGPCYLGQHRLQPLILVTDVACQEFQPRARGDGQGRTLAELGEMLGKRTPEKYRQQRYPFIAHGCGAADEYPVVTVTGHHPGILEPGMLTSVEGYMGAVGGTAGAKCGEQVIVTEGAPELISYAPADARLLQ